MMRAAQIGAFQWGDDIVFTLRKSTKREQTRRETLNVLFSLAKNTMSLYPFFSILLVTGDKNF